MLLILVVSLALLALLPATAAADGLPAVGIDARPLSLPGADVAYVTESGKKATRLIERARYGGPLRGRRLRGSFSIPAVAYDGSPSGLSADGRTLVLISPRVRYPRKRTTFAIVDARRLAVRRRISLKGDFSFDAVSPDGRLMYLVEYNQQDFGEYEVRAYDLRARRLLREPVVDPREPDEEMYGVPVTRAASPDGRWAYTLYDSQEHPFVHALDTSGITAVCIDLDDLPRAWGTTLALNGPHLDVVGRSGRVRARIDRRTHRLVKPVPPRTEDTGTSWLPLAAPTAALLLLAAFTRRRLGQSKDDHQAGLRRRSVTGR
jgi:hypothetical protein